MGIVKTKFTRRNEIRCRILEIKDLSKNVRKTQDRTSLKSGCGTVVEHVTSRDRQLVSIIDIIGLTRDTLKHKRQRTTAHPTCSLRRNL